jgi:hypothetical protein
MEPSAIVAKPVRVMAILSSTIAKMLKLTDVCYGKLVEREADTVGQEVDRTDWGKEPSLHLEGTEPTQESEEQPSRRACRKASYHR